MTPAASLAFRLAAGSHMARQKELESPAFRLGVQKNSFLTVYLRAL